MQDDEETIKDDQLRSSSANRVVNIVMKPSTPKMPEKDKLMITNESQTDPEMFFNYIFEFLNLLENKIAEGDITIEEVIEHGQHILVKTGHKHWSYGQVSPKKAKNLATIQELREILQKLRSLRNYGGDVFFAGLARVLAAKPILPNSYSEAKTLKIDPMDRSKESKDLQHLINDSDMVNLRKMTKVRHSTGGGYISESMSPGKKSKNDSPDKRSPILLVEANK